MWMLHRSLLPPLLFYWGYQEDGCSHTILQSPQWLLYVPVRNPLTHSQQCWYYWRTFGDGTVRSCVWSLVCILIKVMVRARSPVGPPCCNFAYCGLLVRWSGLQTTSCCPHPTHFGLWFDIRFTQIWNTSSPFNTLINLHQWHFSPSVKSYVYTLLYVCLFDYSVVDVVGFWFVDLRPRH